MMQFISIFKHYLAEILPALALGFFLSGLIHEFIPQRWVENNLGKKGFGSIFYATVIGAVLPICCWGALPVAVSFYKKGSKPGPVLAFLVATPATSVSALIVAYTLLGLKFTVFIFLAVILMGILMGVIGNQLSFRPFQGPEEKCPHCDAGIFPVPKRNFSARMRSVFKFAFWQMPKEIGLETMLGIILATAVAAFLPIGMWIKQNLIGPLGYLFALVFGLLMYICATAAVPLVDAFIKQGLNPGAGMTLLLVGPITSYGTVLVLKKEFGIKILSIYLLFISISSLLLGYIFSLI